ncbi:putative 11-oxo-beta-amyrin 30-oxidase [Helianthus debilis subsp. tardiflorus]
MDAVTNTVVISCALVVVLCAWKMLNIVWVRPKKLEKLLRNQGFKGNKYKFLFGDMKESSMLIKHSKSKHINIDDEDEVLPHVVAFTHQSLQKYGRSFITWIGWEPRVAIMDPEMIKDVLMKFNDFQKTRFYPLIKYIATGLVTYEGDQWTKHRKLINPAFHVEKLKNMVPTFHLSCSEMIGKWDKVITSNGSCELDVWPHLQALTCDVISRTAFGSSYQEGTRIFQLLREQSVYAMEAAMSLYIPGSRFLPTKRNRKMEAIDHEVRNSIKSIIHNKLNAMKAGEAGLLVWTMILLAKHQEWQSRAREEVLSVLGDQNIDIDGLNHLKVVNMIFHEVLRLYPSFTQVTRKTAKDITLGGLSLPSGIQIALPLMLIHYDEQLWGSDAKKFKPERFSEGISKATKNQVIYFPFGWGPRICIGQNFALLEAKTALAMILQKFSFELSPSYVHAPNMVLSLQPQYGAQLILHKL